VQVSERLSRAARAAGAVTVLSICLGACTSGLLGSGAPPTFDLTAPRITHQGGGSRAQLVVSEPTALSVLDSDRIVVRAGGDQMSHLANVQWSDRLPKLLQSRIVEAFESGSRLRAVGTPGDRLTADYQLVVEVRAFELSVVSGAVAQVEFSAKVIGDRGGRVVSAKVFRASVPAHSSAGPDAVLALDEAFHQVTTDMVHWAAHVV